MGPELLQREHMRSKNTAINLFNTTRKMGGPEFSEHYAQKLASEIEETYGNFQKHNNSKNIFSGARTPATIFAVMVFAYVISGILGFIGLESLANVLNLILGISLVVLCIWAYVRYSGDFRELGVYIDQIADHIWDKVSIISLLQDSIFCCFATFGNLSSLYCLSNILFNPIQYFNTKNVVV
jgi:atlastin